jgi:hypothetical protein
MKRVKFLLPILLMAMVVAACSPQVAPVPVETPVVSEPLPPTGELPAGVEAAREFLANRLGIPVEDVRVVDYEQVDWPDGCLGLGGPEEACLMAITPGYAVTLEALGEQYAFRTNLEGTAVREDSLVSSVAAVDMVREFLANRLGIPVEEVRVVDYEQVDWPDGCLGLGGPAELCLMAITPGYAVTLEALGEQYAFRTNLEGTAIREDFFVASEAAVDMARRALAERLGIPFDQISVVGQTPVDWPDACLGLPAEDEMCAMVIVPGYEISLQIEDQLFVFRTNEDGSQIREASNQVPASERMRDILAQRLGVSLAQVEPVSEEQVEWPDACLGVYQPDVMCAEVITPGYRLVYMVDGEEFVVHTDLELRVLLLASAPVPAVDEAVIIWEERDFGCSTVLVGEMLAAFGPCDDDLMPALFGNELRAEELRLLVETYRSFDAETEAGTIIFRGEGEQEAGEFEQFAIARWARQVFIESREGYSDPAASQVLEWQRVGGIAGFCDVLKVSASGFAVVENCFNEMVLGIALLDADQLQMLFEWQESYQAFELEEKDDATADAMTVRLSFNGSGMQPASEQDQQAMQAFAMDLFNSINKSQ